MGDTTSKLKAGNSKQKKPDAQPLMKGRESVPQNFGGVRDKDWGLAAEIQIS